MGGAVDQRSCPVGGPKGKVKSDYKTMISIETSCKISYWEVFTRAKSGIQSASYRLYASGCLQEVSRKVLGSPQVIK